MLFLAVENPCAQLVITCVGHRPCDEQLPDLGAVKGQHVAVVFEQDCALEGGTTGGGKVRRRIFYALLSHNIRVLEQAEHKLGAQNAAHGPVDVVDADKPGLDEAVEMRGIYAVLHIHVYAGSQALHSGLGLVGGHAVRHEFAHAEAVADHKTVEAPLLAQYVGKYTLVARRGHTVVGIERGHKRHRPGIESRLEGRQIGLTQLALRHTGGIIVASALGGTIGHEVLGTCSQRCRRPDRVAILEAAHHCIGHYRSQVGVFATSLGYTAPAGITRYVNHGGEGPAHAVGRRFDGGYTRSFTGYFGRECRRLPEWYWEDCLVAVDNVARD